VRAHGRTAGYATLLLAAALGAGLPGCGNPAESPRFTEEQMEALPFPPRADLPAPSGGMVLSVDDETITVGEIIEPYSEALGQLAAESGYDAFRLRARPRLAQVVRDRIIDILLYRRARKAAPERVEEALEKAVEMEVNRFVAGYGHNYAEAQKAIAQMGLDWKGYREYLKRLLLVQSYLSTEIKDDQPVSHGELVAYYDRVKDERFSWPGELQFRVIDIQPDKLTDDQVDAAAGRMRQQAALAFAEELYRRIRAGEDFAEIAKAHSHGHRAPLGGLWRPVIPGSDSLAAPYDALQARAETMQAGQVSEPFAVDGHVFLVKVETNQPGGVKPFAEVQDVVEQEVRRLKQQDSYNRFVDKMLREAEVSNVNQFVDFCVDQAYRKYAAAPRSEMSPSQEGS